MNSLRPNSVCDTTPLKRLESQSSCSEPSSPTLNGGLCVGVTTAIAANVNGGCLVGVNGLSATGHGGSGTTTSSSTTTTSTTLSLTNHSNNGNNNNNNNKSEKSLNIFVNSGCGVGGGGGIGPGDKHKMELYGTRKICCRLLVDLIILACGKLLEIFY